MNTNLHTKFMFFKQRLIVVVIVVASAVAASAVLTAYSSGPAKNGEAVTGAPFNNNTTCTKCHGGGSFGGSIKTKLLDANNNAVTSYVPNQLYTLKITIKKTSTLTAKYGLQTTCATAAGTNVNKWGTLPTGLHNTALSAHNYIEQSSPRTKGTFSIPWTAPAKGTGSVIFYTAGNLVNGDATTTGDQPVNTKLTITEAPAPVPVIFRSFSGTTQNNQATLTWTTMLENRIKNFTVEKSYNGIDYSSIGLITAHGSGDYKFIDDNFHNSAYYRLQLTDDDGNISYYNSITLATPDKNNYQLTLYTHAATSFLLFHNGAQQQKAQVIYTDIQGRQLYISSVEANEGDNVWPIQQNALQRITIINVITADGIKTSLKLAIH